MEMSEKFPREIGALPDVFELVDRFFTSGSIDPSLRFSVDFVLEEIFTNFVKYNPAGASDIGITLAADEKHVKVSLTDYDTDPFDPHNDAPKVDVNQAIEERTPGKLGVHLVKKLMDRMEYSHEDRVSTITFYKKR